MIPYTYTHNYVLNIVAPHLFRPMPYKIMKEIGQDYSRAAINIVNWFHIIQVKQNKKQRFKIKYASSLCSHLKRCSHITKRKRGSEFQN